MKLDANRPSQPRPAISSLRPQGVNLVLRGAAYALLAATSVCLPGRPALARHASAASRFSSLTGGTSLLTLGPGFYDPNYILRCNPWLIKPQNALETASSTTPGFSLSRPRGAGSGLPMLIEWSGPGAAGPAANRAVTRAGFLRTVSRETRRNRAEQFVRFGDEHFHQQQYNLALERYKDAGRSAPDLLEPYFRRAFALSAMSKYAQAAGVLRRGLSVTTGWPDAALQLRQLYGDNVLAKESHWELLAKAATEDAENADLLFLLGVELYCDGQPDRSRAFFQRAQALEQGETSHIQAFLNHLDSAAKPVPPAGK